MVGIPVRSALISVFALAACGDDASHRDSGGQLESGDAGNALPIDARVADSAVLPMDAACCLAASDPCPNETVSLNVTGTSPYGPVQITGARVGYFVDHNYGTRLELDGELGSEPLAIRLEQRAGPALLAAPGMYRAADADASTTLWVSSCWKALDAGAATLLVTNHASADAGVSRGASVAFRGSLALDGPGWALSVPLDIPRACYLEEQL
jgi:hypothetical protein